MKLRDALRRVLFSAALLLSVVAAASAQVRIPAEATQNDAALQAVLTTGDQLESERRWGEALTHYEDALREFPDRSDLQQRQHRSRIHYDIARRYADRSFVASISNLTLTQSLDLYTELLGKVNAHYVQAPEWRTLVDQGTAGLEEALADEIFLKKHLPSATAEQIGGFRSELQRHVAWRPVRTQREARDAVQVAAQLANSRLGLSPTAVVLEYVSGASGGLDTYSTYLTEAQLDDVYSQIEGNFVGLGIELKAEGETLHVLNVIEGSPAQRAGMKAGDFIIAVDGKTTAAVSTDKAADMLKGVEGTTVDVTLQNPAGEVRVVRVRRERVEVPSVEKVAIIDRDNGIGYLKISSFQKTTVRDLDAALWKLHRDGMRSLIIDVRGNPGGLLTASVEAADRFVEDGTIVSTRGRISSEDFDYKAHRVGTWRVPLFVLIDGDSASASEIFAGAIHDLNRGLVIGQRSYGKGSVQGIFPLGTARSGVRLTTAKFYSPSGRAISHQGVVPNLTVRTAAKPIDGQPVVASSEDADPTLTAGLQAARGQLSRRQ